MVAVYKPVRELYAQAQEALTPQQEQFTELFFENHGQLPKKIELGKTYPITFTIHNREHETTIYTYEVSFAADGHEQETKTVIDRNTAVLKHDESKTIESLVTVQEPFMRGKITVELVELKQKIHVWVEEQ